MVLVPPQFLPLKGEYPIKGEEWKATTALSHPLHNTSSSARRHALPRIRVQKQPSTPIEQEEHYLAIVRGRDGLVHLKSSASLKSSRRRILNSITEQFLTALQLSEAEALAQADNSRVELETYQEQDTSILALDAGEGSVSFPFRRPPKRGRARSEFGSISRSRERGPKNPRVRPEQDGVRKTISFEIGDTERAERWIVEAFEAVQQVTCRLIAKLWIKKIEPKKQSAHPYNGGLPKDDPIKDPERTKPPYWPAGIPHKEPDHIQKNQRIILLTHLVMNTPYQQLVPKDKSGEEIAAAELQAQTAERKNDIHPEKYEILQEIFKVRQLMERHLDGGQDGSTVVTVLDYSKTTRLDQGETEEDIEDDIPTTQRASDEEPDDAERAEPSLLTPASSAMPSPVEEQRVQGLNNLPSNSSSSFSNPGCDTMSNLQPVRQDSRSFGASVERSMVDTLMERNATHGMAYGHHGESYSQMQISQPQFQRPSMHPPVEHHETARWADFNNSNSFNHVSNMGASVQSEPAMTDYGIYSSTGIGSIATATDDLPCTEDFYQQQAQLDRMQQQIRHHHNLVPELASRQPRELPYHTGSSQSAQQMVMSRHNSYDQAMMQNSYYQL